MRAAIVHQPLDPAALIAAVAGPSRGAVSLFAGTVRDNQDGRAVTGLEYEGYEEMALAELRAILEEAAARFDTRALAVEHRLGALRIGDMAVIVAAAHAHRANAMDATRYVIEELKRRVPIWKRELYADGTREWVVATTQLPSRAVPA